MNASEQDAPDEMERLVDNHLAALMEHFDAVQINCTRVSRDGNTINYSRGRGNYYARVGMAKEFLDRDKAITCRNEERNE